MQLLKLNHKKDGTQAQGQVKNQSLRQDSNLQTPFELFCRKGLQVPVVNHHP